MNNDKSKEKKDYKTSKRDNTRRSRKSSGKNINIPKNTATMEIPSSKFNDVTWYTHNPLLLEAVSKVAFPYKPGIGIPTLLKDPSKITSQAAPYDIGAIEIIDYALSCGNSDSATSPVSLAAKEIYGKVRASFSSTIADPTDFAIYIMAWDSVYNQIKEMIRVASLLNTFNGSNYLFPDKVLKAMGIDGNTYRSNLPQFISYINTLISMTKKVFVPNIMDIFARHMWMAENVYLDSNTLQSQVVIFNNAHHFKFKLNDANKYGELEAVTADKSTPTTWYEHVLSLIEALLAHSDTYTISGYLERAFSNSTPVVINEISGLEKIMPAYVPEVNMQIKNLTFVPGTINVDSLLISQDPTSNTILHNPTYTFDYALPDGDISANPSKVIESYDFNKTYLNIESDSPAPIDVVLATRLHAIFRTPDSTSRVGSIVCGSEIVESVRVLNYYQTNPYKIYPIYSASDFNDISVAPGGIMSHFAIDSLMSLLPIRIYYTWDGTSIGSYTVLGDINNITAVSSDLMEELHRVCILSEFNAFAL